MRSDMFEIIIERPRILTCVNAKGRRGERTERAFERAPKRLGMGRGRGTKELNENLAPLRRFLASRVGRPWNAVRSEMSAVLSMSSAVQKHVIDHVRHMVEENPVFIDGRPHHPIAWSGRYRPVHAYGRWSHFYVCPRTGFLRQVTYVPRKKPREPPVESTVDAARGMGQ